MSKNRYGAQLPGSAFAGNMPKKMRRKSISKVIRAGEEIRLPGGDILNPSELLRQISPGNLENQYRRLLENTDRAYRRDVQRFCGPSRNQPFTAPRQAPTSAAVSGPTTGRVRVGPLTDEGMRGLITPTRQANIDSSLGSSLHRTIIYTPQGARLLDGVHLNEEGHRATTAAMDLHRIENYLIQGEIAGTYQRSQDPHAVQEFPATQRFYFSGFEIAISDQTDDLPPPVLSTERKLFRGGARKEKIEIDFNSERTIFRKGRSHYRKGHLPTSGKKGYWVKLRYVHIDAKFAHIDRWQQEKWFLKSSETTARKVGYETHAVVMVSEDSVFVETLDCIRDTKP